MPGMFPHLDSTFDTVNARRIRTLKTPQILELSGIGRTDVLDKIGVPLKLNLPGVGENVQEHMIVGFSWGQLFSR